MIQKSRSRHQHLPVWFCDTSAGFDTVPKRRGRESGYSSIRCCYGELGASCVLTVAEFGYNVYSLCSVSGKVVVGTDRGLSFWSIDDIFHAVQQNRQRKQVLHHQYFLPHSSFCGSTQGLGLLSLESLGKDRLLFSSYDDLSVFDMKSERIVRRFARGSRNSFTRAELALEVSCLCLSSYYRSNLYDIRAYPKTGIEIKYLRASEKCCLTGHYHVAHGSHKFVVRDFRKARDVLMELSCGGQFHGLAPFDNEHVVALVQYNMGLRPVGPRHNYFSELVKFDLVTSKKTRLSHQMPHPDSLQYYSPMRSFEIDEARLLLQLSHEVEERLGFLIEMGFFQLTQSPTSVTIVGGGHFWIEQ